MTTGDMTRERSSLELFTSLKELTTLLNLSKHDGTFQVNGPPFFDQPKNT